jgi:hypothetical protein
MSKPVFHRDHIDAFSSFIMDDLLDPERHAIADEQRARLMTYMMIAFYLNASGQPITINAIADKSRFVLRTVSLGESTLVKASHGRGRAYEYAFSAKFVRKVMTRQARLEDLA